MKNKTITNNKGSASFNKLFVGLIALLLLSANNIKAAVTGYTFAQLSGSYVAVTGTTILLNTDDGNSLQNIGFTFNFNSTNFTQFQVNSNGHLRLGATTPTSSYNPISTAGNTNAIAPFGRDGRSVGGVIVSTTGTAPNRVCTIQWTNFQFNWNAAGTARNAQVKLYETTGVVEIVYGAGNADANSYPVEVGLRGTNTASDINNRTSATDWNATVAGTQFSTVGYSTAVTMPAVGLTFQWTPSNCNPPGGLAAVVTGGGTGANISWTAASPVPSGGYQFAVTGSATPPGSGTAFGGLSTSVGSLTPNTTYYLHVRSDCGGGVFSAWSTISFYTGYCDVTAAGGTNTDLTNVTMTGVTNLNNTSVGAGYQNFTAVVPTISQAAGLTVNFTLTYTSDPGSAIYVDWNNDLDFNDANELRYSSGAYILGGTSGSFTVPGGTPAGNYRMRVVVDWLNTAPPACDATLYAESEDYTFVVTAPPTCGIPTGLNATLTSPTTVNISWVAPGLGTVVNYEYAVTTSATPPGSGTSSVATSVTGVAVLANTNYYLHVRTNCTSPVSSSAWVTIGPFYTGYCVPVSTNDPGAFGDNIANFTTTGGLTNINNSSGVGVPFGYQSFTGISCSQIAGGTINFSVTTGGWAHNHRIWVDWNNNLVFEAGEVMYSSGAAAVTNSGSFVVPALQAVGSYRMRVRSVDGTNPIDPCLTYGYTEAEDYTFNVATPPTCYPVSGLTITALDPVNVSFSWTGPVLGNPAVQYFYTVSTSATPPVLGTNNGLLTSVGPVPHTPNAQNYIHVRTDCDGLGTDYSTWVTLPFFSGYCQPTATDPISTYFTNFTTTGGVTNINNNSTNDPSGYQDFSAISASEYQGEDFAVQFTLVGGTAGCNIWIDWNNDLDFNDVGEFVVGSAGFLAAGTYNSVVTVPIAQPFGSYRIRLRTDWNTGNPSACGNIAEGEGEDYTLNVIPLPVCSAVLGSFATTYVTNADLPLVCTGQTVNFLSSPVAPQASGITYQLQYSANIGGPYATVLGPQPTNDFAVAAPSNGYYRIQVLCSGTPLAGTTWTPAPVSISNPAITTTTPASRCGNGTLTLGATNTPPLSTITWYTTAFGGVPVGTGPSFTTPVLSSTTTYYVQAENQVPTAIVGTGVTANATTGQTPFTSFWENTRMFIVVRKTELQAAGLVASDLTSLTFDVSSTGVFGQNNFQIRMAHTTALNANLGFATPNSGFTTVFAPASVPPPALGLRTFNLIGGAFAWNGVDNLIIEICHESDPTNSCPTCYGTNSGVRGSFLTFFSTYSRYQDNLPTCGLDAGTVVLTNFRPNMRIGGQISLCNSPRLPVVATVNAAPSLAAPGNSLFAPTVGNFIPNPILAVSGVGNTVTYSPSAGIYVDAATSGLYTAGDDINNITQYAAPLTTTTYTATATSPDACTTTATFTVTVDASGLPNSACGGNVVSVYNNITYNVYNTLGAVPGIGAPCGGIANEVWFKAVVPASGEVHVSTQKNGGALTDITATHVALFTGVNCLIGSLNNQACNSNGGVGEYSYAHWYGMTPGDTCYIRVAGLSAASVPNGRFKMAVASHLIWTPTNGDNVALAENWQGGDATAVTIPSATRSIWIPAGTTKPKLYANTTVRGVNIQAPAPYYVSTGIDLNSFTLNVKGNWNVGPVASASTTLNCNGLVEFNGTGATAQIITGKTTFGNLNTNNTAGGVQCNNATGVACVLTPVAGTLNGNGNLILKSPSANSAALVAPSAGSITGNVSVERKIGPTSGYHYLSSAVSGALVNNTTSGWRDDFTINAALSTQIFIPGAIYTSLATVWQYDETNANPNPDYGWNSATGLAEQITPLKGFACVVPANVTVDVLGPLNNNIIPGGYTVTRQTDGLNVIGNPYASPISWNAFRALASNTAALSTSGYKAFITTGGYAGAYGTWNGTIGSPVSVTDKIASSQAFMVECLQPAATINALNTCRLTTAADVTATFFNGYNSVPDMIRMEVQGNGHANEMVVYFDASSVDAYNNSYDSKAVFAPVAGVPTIYSTVDNNNLAINVMGKLNMDKVVPLGVKIQTAGTYNLVATDMTSFAPSVIAYLEDTQAGTMTNLRTNPSYSVTLSEGEINNRFFLHFHPAVELNAVNETCAGNDGKLIINYPTSNTVNVVVKDANGNVVASQNNVSGVVTVNNLVAGNYVAEMTFGVAPNTYTTSDYFTVSGGNAVYANLSASATSIDMNANTTVNFTATAQGATSFNWNFGDGTVITNGPANVSHTFAQAGTYTVTFEASNGICNTISTTTVEVTNATGLTTIANSNLQVIGVGSKVTVRFGNKMEGTGNIEVINMLGEVVAHLDNVSMKGTREIEMSSIAAGQYMVKITNNNKLYTEKVYLSRQ